MPCTHATMPTSWNHSMMRMAPPTGHYSQALTNSLMKLDNYLHAANNSTRAPITIWPNHSARPILQTIRLHCSCTTPLHTAPWHLTLRHMARHLSISPHARSSEAPSACSSLETNYMLNKINMQIHGIKIKANNLYLATRYLYKILPSILL